MPTGFAKKELEDAEELVREGKFDSAKTLVQNAPRDIEAYFESETVGESVAEDKFHSGVQQFLKEDSKQELLSTIDRLHDFVDMMKDQGE